MDHLLKINKEFKNLKKQETKYIHRNEIDKACFQHDMTYGDFKDLGRREASDKVLRDKVLNIAKNPKCDGNQRGLANKSAFNNEKIAEELHKPIIKEC